MASRDDVAASVMIHRIVEMMGGRWLRDIARAIRECPQGYDKVFTAGVSTGV